jgi:hypothetical protein
MASSPNKIELIVSLPTLPAEMSCSFMAFLLSRQRIDLPVALQGSQGGREESVGGTGAGNWRSARYFHNNFAAVFIAWIRKI